MTSTGGKSFADYWEGAENWITLASGEYYPDVLEAACNLYLPVLVIFGQLLETSYSSQNLFEKICDYANPWMRVQLCRVFRRYVSPTAPVEMMKIRSRKAQVLGSFGADFRSIQVVQAKFNARPKRDEALCALMWEYRARGQKGYTLTEKFFDLLQSRN